MGVFDKFLNSFGLDSDDYDDEMDYLDDEEEVRPKKSKKIKYEEEPEEEENAFQKTYTNRFMDSSKSQSSRPKPQAVASRSSSKLVPLTSSNHGGIDEIFVLRPTNDDDCWEIIDALKEGKAIIINLEGMNTDDAQHIIDNIVGCCYTIDGDIKRIAPSVFVAAPHDMEINIREDLLNEVLTPGGNMLDLRNEY